MNDPLRKQVCKTLLALQGYSADQIIEGTYQTYPCIEVHVRKEDEPRCPACGIVGTVYDHRVRKILHASISCRPVVLVLTLRRINCAQCGVKTEQQDIAEGLNRHSKDFGNKVLQFTLRSDNASVARIFGVDRSTIYRIDKIELSKLEKGYRGRVPNVDQIAIDEIGYKRRHKYATVITNHEDGRVIDLTMGKSKRSFKLAKMHATGGAQCVETDQRGFFLILVSFLNNSIKNSQRCAIFTVVPLLVGFLQNCFQVLTSFH